MASVVSASSGPQIPRRAHPVRCGHLPRSCFPASLSVAPRPHWRGLLQGAGRLEGGGTQALGQPRSSTVADRGSDSTFQMADRTRRILARGSASTAVCESAHGFLFPSFSPPLPTSCLLPLSDPASVSVLKFQTIKTTHRKYEHVECMVNLCFTPLFSSFFSDLSYSFLPFQKKKNLPCIWLWSSLPFLFSHSYPAFLPPFLIFHEQNRALWKAVYLQIWSRTSHYSAEICLTTKATTATIKHIFHSNLIIFTPWSLRSLFFWSVLLNYSNDMQNFHRMVNICIFCQHSIVPPLALFNFWWLRMYLHRIYSIM